MDRSCKIAWDLRVDMGIRILGILFSKHLVRLSELDILPRR
jgi:hypothetical protein